MAERRKVLPARRPRDRSRDNDALLFRSAETLGRMIGALQRQLDDATRRFTGKGGAQTAMPTTRAATKGGAVRKTAAATKKSTARPKRTASATRKKGPRATAKKKTAARR